jgi:adenosylcobinamide-GDP ribazoletransferase
MRWPPPLQPLAAAVILLTRLPLPFSGEWPDGLSRRAVGWYPAAGVLVGGIGAAVLAAAHALALPPVAASLLALAAMATATGAMHEDGLADTADGIGGGRTPQRRLEIMRDSRIGAYGALALAFAVGLRASALAALAGADAGGAAAALVACAAAARAPVGALAAVLPPARADGMAHAQGRPGGGTVLLSALIGVAVPALLLPPAGAALAAAGAAAAALAAGALARRMLGGITGDVMGAAILAGETAGLLALAALAGRA